MPMESKWSPRDQIFAMRKSPTSFPISTQHRKVSPSFFKNKLISSERRPRTGKEDVKPEAGGGEAGATEGSGEGEISTATGSPDSGATSEGVKLDLKGKSDQAKIAELQKVSD